MSRGCEFFGDALFDRGLDRLDPDQALRLDEHLADCPACAATLRTLQELRAAPLAVPADLESRIRTAVREQAKSVPFPVSDGVAVAAGKRRDRRRFPMGRAWALPLAAAAALAVFWLGGREANGGAWPGDGDFALLAELEPYGAWPAGDRIIAGEPVLSELSVAELERLLEELEL
jgi:anti-sigma factor RsiW